MSGTQPSHPDEIGFSIDMTVRNEWRNVDLLRTSVQNCFTAVFADVDTFRPDRDPNPHLAFGAGVHFCLGAPLARMELVESLGHLLRTFPGLTLAGEPESRGTFVLRGNRRVPVAAGSPTKTPSTASAPSTAITSTSTRSEGDR